MQEKRFAQMSNIHPTKTRCKYQMEETLRCISFWSDGGDYVKNGLLDGVSIF